MGWFVCVGSVWLWVGLINFAKEGRNITRSFANMSFEAKFDLTAS